MHHATVAEGADIEVRDRTKETRAERLARRATAFAGSMAFVLLNLGGLALWIAVNLPGSPLQFDPFPFTFLTALVSWEVVFLAIFVLISEDAQARRTEQRARLDMQVNIIAEREVTKLLEMISDIHEHLGLSTDASEVREMLAKTRISRVADTVEAADRNETP